MNPTLRDGDALWVIPYGNNKIYIGDVVLFHSRTEKYFVAHRVVSVDSQGIRTGGDNRLIADKWILVTDNIIGRVVYAQRGKKRVRIYGGLIGRTVAFSLRACLVAKKELYSLIRPVYLHLAKSGVFRRFLPGTLKIRLVSFERLAGTELQLLMGRHVIGNRPPGETRWKIRPPFRLFIDETSLPV